MLDSMFVFKVTQAHNLSEVMVGAIVSGENGESVTAGPKQIKALLERGIVNEEDHTLTEFGQLIARLFTAPETLTEEDRDSLLVSSAPSAKGSFLVDTSAETLAQMIRPTENGEEGLTFAAAKEELADWVIGQRDLYRDMLKGVRSLRKKDVTGDDESAPEDSDESEADENAPAFA
jgi:hypothetical protein